MATATTTSTPTRKPFYKILYVKVLIAIATGIVVGHFRPDCRRNEASRRGFIKLIKMVIGLVIFCTVVSGIAGMEDMKKVGRSAARRCSTSKSSRRWPWPSAWWSATGLSRAPVSMPIRPPGRQGGRPIRRQGQEQTITEFLMNVIPNTVIDAFAKATSCRSC